MRISRDDLHWAVTERLLLPEQEKPLWEALSRRGSDTPRFDTANVAYFFGAMIVISAMGWFLTEAWDLMGGAGLMAFSLAYAFSFVLAGNALWSRPGLRTPGGLLFALAVWMTPIAIFGLEDMLGIWPGSDPGGYTGYHLWIKGSWVLMEVGTILAGLVALRFRRFPFLTFPIAFALWYLSMDLAPLLLGTDRLTFEERAWISLFFGGAMLVAAYLIDLRGRVQDFAFWGYLFGLFAFWGGLMILPNENETAWFIDFLVNLALVFLSLFLRRRIFLVVGSIGVAIYIGHLAWEIFEDSLMFPLVLTVAGLAIIALGIAYQRSRPGIEAWIDARIPAPLLGLVPERKESRA